MFETFRQPHIISTILAFAATAVQAAPSGSPMFLAIHSGHPGAAEIVDANYVDGERRTRTAVQLAKIANYWPSNRLELRNNLCVAQIMQGDYPNARKTCDRAVSQAKHVQPKYRQTRYGLRSLRAIAFSNRGVLRVLDGDMQGAKSDFNAALRVRPELDSAVRNLNAMGGANNNRTLAQVNLMRAKSR